MKIEKIVPGMKLYLVTSRRMGNTTMTCQDADAVEVVSVHPDGSERSRWPHIIVKPNKIVNTSVFSRMRAAPPEWLRNGCFGRKCSMCYAKESDGHHETCRHPRAARARAKAGAA